MENMATGRRRLPVIRNLEDKNIGSVEVGSAQIIFTDSEFMEMGASKVWDLFKQAKEKVPCIVFIDEY